MIKISPSSVPATQIGGYDTKSEIRAMQTKRDKSLQIFESILKLLMYTMRLFIRGIYHSKACDGHFTSFIFDDRKYLKSQTGEGEKQIDTNFILLIL